MKNITYEYYFHPGKYLTETQQKTFVNQLRSVAEQSLPGVPFYQVLTGKKEDLEKALVIVVKYQGKIIGFSSTLVLQIPGIGPVYHAGLVCIAPAHRNKNLLNKLFLRLMIRYFLLKMCFKKVWITNCSCVLAVLGSVELYLDKAYPALTGAKKPSEEQLKIARFISTHYRNELAINSSAYFNEKAFVFKGSVMSTCFHKDIADTEFYHRSKRLNDFYLGLINFKNGDEVLQIGTVSLLVFLKYIVKRLGSWLRSMFKKCNL